MNNSIPIEFLSYQVAEGDFQVWADGTLHIWYSPNDGKVDSPNVSIYLPGDIAFALMHLFDMPGVREIIDREELARQRARHQDHVKYLEREVGRGIRWKTTDQE